MITWGCQRCHLVLIGNPHACPRCGNRVYDLVRSVPAPVDGIQADLASAVARIRQAYAERGTPLGELLLLRLAECDAPRLERHLGEAARKLLAES